MSMEVYQMWSYEEKAERVARLFAQEQAMADLGVRQQIFVQIHRIYLTQFPSSYSTAGQT